MFIYSIRDQIVRFAYFTSLLAEGKQTRFLYKPDNTDKGTQTASYKYRRGEVMCKIWAARTSLPAAPPTTLFLLPFTSNGRRTHRFEPTTEQNIKMGSKLQK
jgi:hypothetical protein